MKRVILPNGEAGYVDDDGTTHQSRETVTRKHAVTYAHGQPRTDHRVSTDELLMRKSMGTRTSPTRRKRRYGSSY